MPIYDTRQRRNVVLYHGQRNDASDAPKSAIWWSSMMTMILKNMMIIVAAEYSLHWPWRNLKKIFRWCYTHSEQIAIKFLDFVAVAVEGINRATFKPSEVRENKTWYIYVLQPTPPHIIWNPNVALWCNAKKELIIDRTDSANQRVRLKKLCCTERVGRYFFWLTYGSEGNI